MVRAYGRRAFRGHVDEVDSDLVDTDKLNTTPAGVRLTKTSSETLANGSDVTPISWESASEYNASAQDFADLNNDAVTIPSDDYNYAYITVGLELPSRVEIDYLFSQLNTNYVDGQIRVKNLKFKADDWRSSLIAVSSGDTIRLQIKQSSGSDVDIKANNGTFFEVVAW
jgi:hypothetical protein